MKNKKIIPEDLVYNMIFSRCLASLGPGRAKNIEVNGTTKLLKMIVSLGIKSQKSFSNSYRFKQL